MAGLPDASSWYMPSSGIGFCGALTTFSTLAFELWVFLERHEWKPFAATLALSLGVGLPRRLARLVHGVPARLTAAGAAGRPDRR